MCIWLSYMLQSLGLLLEKIILDQNILCTTFISTFIWHFYHLHSYIELKAMCEVEYTGLEERDYGHIFGTKWGKLQGLCIV